MVEISERLSIPCLAPALDSGKKWFAYDQNEACRVAGRFHMRDWFPAFFFEREHSSPGWRGCQVLATVAGSIDDGSGTGSGAALELE